MKDIHMTANTMDEKENRGRDDYLSGVYH